MSERVVLSVDACERIVDCWLQTLFRDSKCHVIWPKDLGLLIQAFAQVSSELVVGSHISIKLLCGFQNSFDRVVIEPNGTLRASHWDSVNAIGGVLQFTCNELIVKGKGSLNADHCGYKGGFGGRQGESYTGTGKHLFFGPNGGGGGYCGHAGHATAGVSTFDFGGMQYGSEELGTLYLGSGGGSGFHVGKYTVGGNGGGIVDITVRNNLWLEPGGMISANGEKGGNGAGDGSGGSIRVVCEGNVYLAGRLSANGGSDKAGNGRIAIFSKQTPFIESTGICIPPPFVRVNGGKKTFAGLLVASCFG